VIPVTVVFQGSFYDLSDFLYRLQSLVLVENHKLSAKGRLFTVDQVSFAEGDKGFPQIKATLAIDAYVYRSPRRDRYDTNVDDLDNDHINVDDLDNDHIFHDIRDGRGVSSDGFEAARGQAEGEGEEGEDHSRCARRGTGHRRSYRTAEHARGQESLKP